MNEETLDPRFEGISDLDVIQLGFICSKSSDPSDIEFTQAAKTEINRRARSRRLEISNDK